MLIRSIWNDGQSLTTPEIQRNCDIAAYADDRVYENLFGLTNGFYGISGPAQKRVLPLYEEYSGAGTINPRIICKPGSVNGKVSVRPCTLVAGTPEPSVVAMSAVLGAEVDSPAIASNVSGSNRYDLIYATINRTVAATIGSPPASTYYAGIGPVSAGTGSTQSRKIKSVADGSISTQSLNIYDVPTVTISVNSGFLTGATPPTSTQIATALPADSATAYNFALGYVTVANGYTAGNTINQSTITQVWSGGWLHQSRVRGIHHTPSLYTQASAAQPATTISDRWGGVYNFFCNAKFTTSIGSTIATGAQLDTTINWQSRVVWGWMAYIISATNELSTITSVIAGTATGSAPNNGFILPCTTGVGVAGTIGGILYNAGSSQPQIAINAGGGLVLYRPGGGPQDAANGDLLVIALQYTDQITAGM